MRLFRATLRGYREWSISRLGRLQSLSRATTWGRVPLHAECRIPLFFLPTRRKAAACEDPPQPGCKCGIYAWYEPQVVRPLLGPNPETTTTELLKKRLRSSYHTNYAFGVIRASGVIMPHEFGFRAEKAEIEALLVGEDVSLPYYKGIPVLHDVEDFLKAYPPDDVSQLVKR